MSPSAILADLAERGIAVAAHDGKLRVAAPAGALTPELRAELVAQKSELLAHLTATEDQAAFLTQAQAAFPGSSLVTDIPVADLEDAFRRFCWLTGETYPDMSSTERLGEALRCLHELLPGGEREASDRVQAIALFAWERFWSLTVGEMEGLL